MGYDWSQLDIASESIRGNGTKIILEMIEKNEWQFRCFQSYCTYDLQRLSNRPPSLPVYNQVSFIIDQRLYHFSRCFLSVRYRQSTVNWMNLFLYNFHHETRTNFEDVNKIASSTWLFTSLGLDHYTVLRRESSSSSSSLEIHFHLIIFQWKISLTKTIE